MTRRCRPIFSFFLFVSILILTLTSMSWSLDSGEIAKKTESFLENVGRQSGFSGTVLIAKDGVPFYGVRLVRVETSGSVDISSDRVKRSLTLSSRRRLAPKS